MNFAGTPTWPAAFPLVDDASLPSAAQFNPALEALGDRTAYLLQSLLQSASPPSLNWAAGAPVLGTKYAAAYEPSARKWIAVSPLNGNDVHASTDHGLTWEGMKATLDAISAGATCTGVDIAPDGSAVIARSGSVGVKVWSFNGAAWSEQSVSGDTGTDARVAYAPAAGLWCLVYLVGTTPKVYTSPDRVTWTARTAPALSTPSSHALVVNRTTGRLTWMVDLGTGDHIWATSDDGGVTWTLRNLFAQAGTWNSGFNMSIGDDGRIYVPIANAGATYLYRSDDEGVTFTLVRTLTTAPLGRVAAIGDLVVGALNGAGSGLLAAGDVLYSTDRGLTWKTSLRLGAAAVHTFGGGGGLLAFGTAGATWRSLRIGDPGALVA